jgi:hypothetical protein
MNEDGTRKHEVHEPYEESQGHCVEYPALKVVEITPLRISHCGLAMNRAISPCEEIRNLHHIVIYLIDLQS